jgi:hypothetical protein
MQHAPVDSILPTKLACMHSPTTDTHLQQLGELAVVGRVTSGSPDACQLAAQLVGLLHSPLQRL